MCILSINVAAVLLPCAGRPVGRLVFQVGDDRLEQKSGSEKESGPE